MQYPSHIKENHVVQTHKEHLEAVAGYVVVAEAFWTRKTCQLTGLLRYGEGTCEFAAYIEYSYAHPGNMHKKVL